MREWNHEKTSGRSHGSWTLAIEAGFWAICACLGVIGSIAVLL